MASVRTANYYAPISSYAPFKPSPLAKQNATGNSSPKSPKAWQTRAPEKKPSSVVQAVEGLYVNSRFVRDANLELPKFLPRETPLVISRTNTHRGKNITVFEGRPELIEGYLFLGAEVPAELNAEEKLRFCISATEYMASRAKVMLEKMGAYSVNASLLSKKPNTSQAVTLFLVVAFE